ncbi:hypothetical protein T492DRAFT_1059225 [Pavlovales sp. CCMP2436]|nr:hypothetical protein T492DRAFT_1059225 [Pavlovales sp. CCMP2436]
MRTRQLLEGLPVPDAGVAGLHAVEGEQGHAWKQGHVPPPQAHGAHRSSARRGSAPAEAEVRARLLSWYGLSRCTNGIVACHNVNVENFVWQLAMRAPGGGSQPQERPAPGESSRSRVLRRLGAWAEQYRYGHGGPRGAAASTRGGRLRNRGFARRAHRCREDG